MDQKGSENVLSALEKPLALVRTHLVINIPGWNDQDFREMSSEM
jgi:hypothetical protein